MEQTPELCLEAVKKDGRALEFVKEQTPELCLEAVKQTGYALEFVKEQTPELCLEAVKHFGFAIKFVKEQTPEICLESVKNYGMNLFYVKEQTREICIEAVKHDGFSLQYVKEQTREICIEAVRQDGRALQHVNPEFINLLQIIDSIEPTEFVAFPSHLNLADFTDPITLEELVPGEVYGFLVEDNTWYLAGSLKNCNTMIKQMFRGSSKNKVFVPIKNKLVPVEHILWVKI